MKIISIVGLLLLNSCTYSMNMVHTHGYATDVIDESQTNQPNVNPEISVPAL
jgi:hypothetical protein